MDQHFDPHSLATSPAKSFVIDISGVSRVTSTGVRQWMKGLDEITAEATYLVGCRTSFLTQANLVAGFLGNLQVTSLYLPYFCEQCDEEFESHVDLRLNAELSIPTRYCPTCNHKAEFDDDPASFLSNPALSSLTYQVEDVNAVIDTLVCDKWDETIIQLDMQRNFVALWLSGALKEETRYSRILRDIGDAIVIMAGGIGQVGRGSLVSLQKALKHAGQDVCFARVPISVIRAVRESDEHIDFPVVSVSLPFHCQVCDEERNMDVFHDLLKDLSRSRPLQGIGTSLSEADPTTLTACRDNNHEWVPSFDISERLVLTGLNWHKPSERIYGYLHATEGLFRLPAVIRAGATEFQKGDLLRGFRLEEKIGAGGMGDVYRARETDGLDREVAIKVISPTLLMKAEYRQAFLNEARIAARFNHPNIVQVYQLGEHKGIRFLVMEYIDGPDLASVCSSMRGIPKMPERVGLWIVHQILSGLQALHQNSDGDDHHAILHRDVSPQNVMLGYDGTVKLADFGVAAALANDHIRGPSRGKQAYWAPEIIRDGICTVSTDLYAVGVIFYEMLAARRLFKGHAERSVDAAMRVLPEGITVKTRDIILRAVAEDPATRYGSAAQMKADVVSALGTFATEEAQESLSRWLSTFTNTKSVLSQ